MRIGTTTSLFTKDLSAYYGANPAFENVSLNFEPCAVTALMGPSGCGKTTLLRCLNRIHETTPGARITGSVQLDDVDIYSSDISPIALRRRIGMVFQRANPFPTLSIIGNVVAGLGRSVPARAKYDVAQRSLAAAGFWNEVKDRLHSSVMDLSGGQQQRLCIARALAIEPQVLLMDEPTSSLDPLSTATIEDLISELSKQYTILIVTHNMQQAARVSDFTAFMLGEAGRAAGLVEFDRTEKIFTKPADRRTEDYITGRFG